jgi:peptide-methionine (S)-S-oxide reductase
VNPPASLDARFRDAVAAIDAGDLTALAAMLTSSPALARERLRTPGAWLRDQVGGALDGFFKDPYLLWFVAEDPVRNGTLPPNIAEVARAIVDAVRRDGAATLQAQLDYAIRLVAWSGVAAAAGVQIALVDVLADAGAALDGATDDALVNGHARAAAHLVARGAPMTLATALCLDRDDDARRLGGEAAPAVKQFACVLAALNGRARGVRLALDLGAGIDTPSQDLYPHGTPLHHAVSSGSLDTVKVLVEAGADLDVRDTAFGGTPLGWAEYAATSGRTDGREPLYLAIADYLRRAASAAGQP